MNIVIVADHYAVASGRYAMDAFRRLGHTVQTLGVERHNDIWGLKVDPRHIWKPTEVTQDPDLVVVMDSAPHILDFAASIVDTQHGGAPVVVWGVDNHVRDYRRPQFARYFLAHKAVSIMDWTPDMQWLPCGYDPVAFTPSPKPFHERDFDFALVGVNYVKRNHVMGLLSRQGYRVAYGLGLLYDDFAAVYHNARVSLCVGAAGDVAQRVFETAALGCGLLCDYAPDLANIAGFEQVVQVGNNATDEQWLDAARLVYQDAAYAAQCQAAAAPHTWDARAAKIVEWFSIRGV